MNKIPPHLRIPWSSAPRLAEGTYKWWQREILRQKLQARVTEIRCAMDEETRREHERIKARREAATRGEPFYNRNNETPAP